MLMWYVIQVRPGREDAMAALIGRMAPADVLAECFSPTYATERKIHGRWVPCTRTLLPGYLIADTADPVELNTCLGELPEFCRLLTQGNVFVPLGAEEAAVIASHTAPGERVVPLSHGVKDGDTVVVTAGPLVGHEGLIERIDRRKNTAYLTFNMCGVPVSTRMGLAVLADDKRIREDMRAYA